MTHILPARRPLWRPGSTPPAHLDGSMPGDFGFDPLGLGVSSERLAWCVLADAFELAIEGSIDPNLNW